MRRRWMGALAAAAVSAMMAGPALAAPVKPVERALPSTTPTLPGDLPELGDVGAAAGGRVIVHTGKLGLPAGRQVRGQVTCPGGKVPLSGGALIASSALF